MNVTCEKPIAVTIGWRDECSIYHTGRTKFMNCRGLAAWFSDCHTVVATSKNKAPCRWNVETNETGCV